MSGLTLRQTGTTLSHSRYRSPLRIPVRDARLQAAMRCAQLLHRGYALLSTSIPHNLGQQRPPDSTQRPPQPDPCSRNLDRAINKLYKPLKQPALLNIAREETKSRCGGRASGDVIAKSTKARKPEILPSKEFNDILRLTFHAVESVSVVGVTKQATTYRYE